MASIAKKNINQPDETQTPPKMRVEIVSLDGVQIQRVTAEPGWRWSQHTKPTVGGESCQKHHFLYVLSGRVSAKMDEGEELEFDPNEVGVIPPGHDGWTVGDEPAVWLELPH